MKYYLWNMLANIKNAQKAKKSIILQKKKKNIASILNILWDEGFILGYKISCENSQMFKIFIRYNSNNPIIKNLQTITKPSRRIYCSVKQIWKINSNLGLFILSTNKGILSLDKCKKQNLGGELFLIIK